MAPTPLTLADQTFTAAARLAELLSGDVRIEDPAPLLAVLRATEIMLGRCYQELADAAEGADRDDAAADLRSARDHHVAAGDAAVRALLAFSPPGRTG
ncbi:hypothetical protein ACQSSU_20585 [Micromonospora echinospora]